MRFRFLGVWFVVFFLSSSIAFSHMEGHGPIDKSKIIPVATEQVAALIEQGIIIEGIGKLDKSWNKISAGNKKIVKEGSNYYIISFKDSQKNKTLYLLFASNGDFYDANFTGIFKGLGN